ncbi:MAG: methyltransferase domain-containing protein [Deltaproteobacteria bacterium]|nr:methyltransferase domain-containing protein [Deltaproteobacteria bacterium]MCL5793046.1 methyltransferase domain-containing protein [Deltaproteobacteria bacterium]
MNGQSSLIRWKAVVVVILAFTVLYIAGVHGLTIETDITASLPKNDPVIADARYVITHYPVFDRVFIDIGVTKQHTDDGLLMTAATYMQQGLRASGLFKEVGLGTSVDAMPLLLSHIVSNLPSMFSLKELETSVLPLLGSASLRSLMDRNMDILQGLEGMGQSGLIARDPLGLRNIVLARMASLLPVHGATINNNFIMSRDRRHILIIAEPKQSSTDTNFALKINALINKLIAEIDQKAGGAQQQISITPIGSYRAAIDNETIARRDTMRALLLSTIGIALLLLISFPRWYIGLMALVPALAGTSAALFVMSLLRHNLSILAIGFGGAIISINVDYGIAYLLFLDQAQTTSGTYASRQSFWVGLGASLTTVGSFLALSFSGFPILAEIGWFTAMGTLFSFAFVHTIFPLVFRRVSPARHRGIMPMEKITSRLVLSSGWTAFIVAGIFGLVMAFFARPAVKADVEAMNTESAATHIAESNVKKTWGDILSDTTYILIQGSSVKSLQDRADRLDTFIRARMASGVVRSGFSPLSIFPGEALARKNEAAWKAFWTTQRVQSLRGKIAHVSKLVGFSHNAFEPFFEKLMVRRAYDTAIPRQLYGMLGISRGWDNNTWMMISAVRPGPYYNPEIFYKNLSGAGIGKMLDAHWFTVRLSNLLFTMFVRMGILCGVGLVVVLVFYFMDFILVILALVPVAFALVSTFATYHFLHRPLDIPSLLLVVVVFGMGSDYSIYFIGAYQRYFDEHDPAMSPIRTAVFLNAGSTITGLGVLAFAGQAMLKSAGLSMVLGLGYALIGTVTLLPPILRVLYAPRKKGIMPAVAAGSPEHRARVLSSYRYMETYVRMFARFKIKFDPMFSQLADFVGPKDKVMDLGCGYGVPSAWLMHLYPSVYLFGVDPNQDRVRVARRALGDRGTAVHGEAPDFPKPPHACDAVLMLDIIHYLSDEEFAQTLASSSSCLKPGGSVVIRATVPSSKHVPWERWLEQSRLTLRGQKYYFRTSESIVQIISKAGFTLTYSGDSAKGREETWFVCMTVEHSQEPL